MKPSMGRQTRYGEFHLERAAGGMTNLQGSKGPIGIYRCCISGRCVDDVAVMLKVIFDKKEELPPIADDFYWQPHPFNDDLYRCNKKLKVGYITGYSLLPPATCMKRAVDITKQVLKDIGHEVVEFQIEEKLIEDIMAMFFRILSAEGNLKSFKVGFSFNQSRNI